MESNFLSNLLIQKTNFYEISKGENRTMDGRMSKRPLNYFIFYSSHLRLITSNG